MSAVLSNFTFDVNALRLDERGDFIAYIPRSLTDRPMLFEALRNALELPNYFGENWDALSEILRDLSWIDRRRVAILHGDVPPLGCDILTVYLDVLSDCVADWKPGENHELVVGFPNESCDAITAIVHNNEREKEGGQEP